MTVSEIKAALKLRGFDLADYESAVEAFQKSAGLVVDGIAGSKTQAALKATVATKAPPVASTAFSVTAAQLRKVAGGKAILAEATAEAFNRDCLAYGITTPKRAAHFLAQICHESDHLQTATEYASGAAYEGRKDLGNTVAGDGKRFRGRGLIQVTGRANTTEFTVWVRRLDPSAPDFVADPTKLALFPWALVSAFWYWDKHKLNTLADADNVLAITKKINGGTNGLADRQAALARAKATLGL